MIREGQTTGFVDNGCFKRLVRSINIVAQEHFEP